MKKTMQKLLMALLMGCCTLLTYAQQRTVTGTVTNDAGTPIPNTSLTIDGSSSGGITDENGNFSININGNNVSIEFSAVGFQTKKVTVGSEAILNVILLQSNDQMEGVVVTALGIRRQAKELGYATSVVGSKELTKTGSPNFAGALYGKAPGVRITASPGGATSGVNINIRGINSITGNSQPLVIIDGVPMRQSTFNNSDYWGDQRARGNGLEDLNPEDIESISILKGASAAALYGSEALNGVVLVTTKSGKAGKGFSIDFNTTYTHDQIAYLPRFQEVRGPGAPISVSNVGQAADLFFYVDRNGDGTAETRGVTAQNLSFGPKFDGQPTLAWDGVVRPYNAQNNYKGLFNNPNNTTFNLALGHTTENSSIRFSLTRQDNQMTTIGSTNAKNIANLNASFNLWERLKTDVVVNYVNQQTHNRPFLTDRLVNNFTGMITTFDNPDWYLNKYRTSLGYKYVTGTNQSVTPDENLIYNGYKTDVLDYFWNTLANQYDERSNRLIGSFTNTLQITKEFSLRGRFSADMTSAQTEDKKPNERPLSLGNTGSYGYTQLNANIYYLDALATYRKQISTDFGVGVMAGYTATKFDQKTQISETNGGLSVENWYNINASVNAATTRITPQTRINDALIGTVSTSFKDFWFVEGTIRRERVSTMPANNNTLTYPSVNSSLVLSQLFRLPEIVNYAKLRGSWGIVGKYPDIYQSALSYTQNTLGNQGTGTPALYTIVPTTSFGNEKIKPENKHEFEFGLEAKLFKNRLGLDITYYNGQIVDQILNYTLPYSSGANSILANVGTLRNKGWEFGITGTPVKTANFNWFSALNFSTNKNIVEKLPGGAAGITHRNYDGDAAQLISYVGQSMGDIMVHPIATDANGNKIVQENGIYKLSNDWIKAGNAMPKIVGGFINNLSYKSFSLDLLLDYRFGGHVMPTGINWMISRGLLEESLNAMDEAHGGLRYYLDANGKGVQWTGTTGPNGEAVYNDGMLMEGVLANGTPNTNVVSQARYYNQTYNWGGPQYSNSRYELYVKKNNYIKMREISIAYRLPHSIASKVHAKNLQLSVFGRNLFFLHRTIKDLDPEQMTGGSNWINQVSNAGTGPATRTIGVMLRASF